MLEVLSLYCERDDRILFENLNFSLAQGEIIQIEGQNGSGKTSLLRILCGLSNAYEGRLFWQGQPIELVQENFYQSLLYIGHHSGVKVALTPEENLRWMVTLHPTLGKISIHDALKKVGLYGYEDVPCYTLSAGQQRRVGLARLYMSNAPLWVLDEPFTALDRKGIAEKEVLIAQHINGGGSVVLTTHHDLTIPEKNVRQIDLDTALNT
jgi:heme exporter protein A